ncbi:Bestrophin, RFP-TM, chloride channel-domain-containing protein [Suillus occidentalis]|nr:Bestrophin, RFP-TM, chloride channel-domain-containing protein [Suillus occidentalis]
MESKAESPSLDSSESEATLTADQPLICWGTLLFLWDKLSTTALSRCWPSLIVTGIWSSSICVFNHFTNGKLAIQPTLITVFGTVLGFVISFRTSSSFDRYNEGRKLWAQIVLNCRIFARTVWFHVPGMQILADKAKTLEEKKKVIDLLEAYAVAVKHYLRGEEGIGYQDLKPLVPFISSCNHQFPATISSTDNQTRTLHRRLTHDHRHDTSAPCVPATQAPASRGHLVAAPGARSRPAFRALGTDNTIVPPHDEESLRPAEIGPRHCWRTAFPFPFLFWVWTNLQKLCKLRANDASQKFCPKKDKVPLEISMYLTTYICKLQARRIVDDPTLGLLYTTLNQLVDALTGLERILTTPIPISCVSDKHLLLPISNSLLSYSSHLWIVTMVYCATLPFQLWSTLEWFTIPASVIASFVFYGFIVAGEEIESTS